MNSFFGVGAVIARITIKSGRIGLVRELKTGILAGAGLGALWEVSCVVLFVSCLLLADY